VATSSAGGVGASVGRTGVVEGTAGADRIGMRSSRGDVAISPAVFTLRVPIGGVSALNRS